ncbi:hypothetical protein GGR54DRAFT_435887 [Hypoxylon sp. NC1633]|nr:hypothetical protein GGR54DRAFT_435887 [Hypoxylon sp. NC1633]
MSTKDPPPSFSSNNPFRRKLGDPSSDSPSPPPASNLDGSFDSVSRPPFTTFKSAMPKDDGRKEEEETRSVPPKPKKVVKKVRVQSPPPSSPEDAVPVTRFPPVSDSEDDEDDSSDSHFRPLSTASFPTGDREVDEDEDSSGRTQARPAANPFSKTLQDIEHPDPVQGQEQDANALAASAAAAKGTLDVDSFKRLLLTGYANIPGPSSTSVSGVAGNTGGSSHTSLPLQDGASNTDASSVSRQSIFDAIIQDTPRTSHEISESEDPEERRGILPSSPLSTITSSSTKKKPPPPSSRHGKLIKIELGADVETRRAKDTRPAMSISTTSLPAIAPPRKSGSLSILPSQPPSSTTDVNKPLPLTPFRPSVEEAVDSPFDREAIGKVPEPFTDLQTGPRPPTPPITTRNRSESNGSTQLRKPAAPPPRRHGRSDSRAPSIIATDQDDDTPPRSSLESTRSRTDSLRANTSLSNIFAPAPPPPRRPNHARQGSSYTSPSQGSFASMPATSPGINENERSPIGTGFSSVIGGQLESLAGLATITTSKDGLPKLSPPPPPPARQASTRRPPSVRSMDTGNGTGMARRVSKEKEGGTAAPPPPPPPPPPRQRGSSRASVEAPPASVAEGARNVSSDIGKESAGLMQSSGQETGDNNQGQEILADLDALQKEVDALMDRYGKPTES